MGLAHPAQYIDLSLWYADLEHGLDAPDKYGSREIEI